MADATWISLNVSDDEVNWNKTSSTDGGRSYSENKRIVEAFVAAA